MAQSCATNTSETDVALDTVHEDEDVIEVNPRQDVTRERKITLASSKVEISSTKWLSIEKPGVKKKASETGPDKDVVDGDISRGAGHFADIKESGRKDGKHQFEYRAQGTNLPLNLPTDCIVSSPNNRHNLHNFKKACRPLTVKITTKKSKGSGTLTHPKSWKTFRDSLSLHQISMQPKAKSASLTIKTTKKMIASDEDAASATAEITLYNDDQSCKKAVKLQRCSKAYYDIEDCNLLVCHDVPMEICQYLEKAYETLYRLAETLSHDVMFSKKFLLIGHRNGGEVVISEGDLINTVNAQGYKYLSLEESADHFFARTMEMTPEEWSSLKETICPGDESISVIRFAADRLY